MMRAFLKLRSQYNYLPLAGRELQQYCQAQEVKQNNKKLKTEKALK